MEFMWCFCFVLFCFVFFVIVAVVVVVFFFQILPKTWEIPKLNSTKYPNVTKTKQTSKQTSKAKTNKQAKN